MAAQNKLREQLSQTFLAALQEGRLPWKACWQTGRPFNVASKQLYRGTNALLLSYLADEKGYTDPRWCTYRQAQARGWQVRAGEKAAPVEYWAYYDTKAKQLLPWPKAKQIIQDDREYAEKYLQLRCRVYSVFNAAQMDGPEPFQAAGTNIDEIRSHRDALIRNMGVGYREQGSQAYYSPASDTVTLPPEASFDDVYAYTCTFLHECGHATGHESRLNRNLTGGFGSESYAQEELRAEIASAFTAQAIGLRLTDQQLQQHMDLHKAYIQGWAENLADAPGELYAAIKDAGAISDYLLEKGEFEQVQIPEEALENPMERGCIRCRLTAREEGGLLLRISGQGPIPDYQTEAARPWQDRAEQIREVYIEDGVTAVGDRAFFRMENLEKVWLPSTVERLGLFCMEDCTALQTVEYAGDWDRLQKGTGCLPAQFAAEPMENARDSYLPVGARPDADGRLGTVSSDFTPDALVRSGAGGKAYVVSTGFRTETLDPGQAEPDMEPEMEP